MARTLFIAGDGLPCLDAYLVRCSRSMPTSSAVRLEILRLGVRGLATSSAA